VRLTVSNPPETGAPIHTDRAIRYPHYVTAARERRGVGVPQSGTIL
jgi:hypothetical protein